MRAWIDPRSPDDRPPPLPVVLLLVAREVANGRGWGSDPQVRALRGVAVVVLTAMVVWLLVVEDGPNDIPALGTILGAMLVLLGFEGARWRSGP